MRRIKSGKTLVLQLSGCVLAGMISGCSFFQQMAQIQKPTADAAGVRLTGLGLEGVDLVLDLNVTNPNPLAVRLAGFDYDLSLDAASFLKGNQRQPLSIPAQGTGRVEIPFSLNFREIYQTYQSLRNSDSVDYAISAGLTFDLPVIGATRIPVRTSGRLPLVKIPKISVSGLRIAKMGFTGADLELDVMVDNPNTFSFMLGAFDYDFRVNGLSWARGKSEKGVDIREKGKQTLQIPISLDFLQMGQAVAGLLRGDDALEYQFGGGLDLQSSVPLIGKVQLPFDLAGTVPLMK
ncbi:MAG TPA: hypothetical protein ENN17_04070 [bacterium]|nr:hypothetical protein [bacterium]